MKTRRNILAACLGAGLLTTLLSAQEPGPGGPSGGGGRRGGRGGSGGRGGRRGGGGDAPPPQMGNKLVAK